MTQSPQPSAEVPGILFDSYAVLKALDKKATARTSAENVCDVLDAVVRLLRAVPVPSPEAAPGAGEGKPFGWFYEMDSSANPKAGPTYLGSNDQKVTQLVADARAGTLKPVQLQGSTFTVSNFGALGLDEGVPVINHPEAAILGMGSLKPRAVVVDGLVVARPTMALTCAFDHRVADGAQVAAFLRELRDLVESPELALLDL
jgi:pyruvate dehydrogenase E2 component (dihydrolipoamide acetyltransferase)